MKNDREKKVFSKKKKKETEFLHDFHDEALDENPNEDYQNRAVIETISKQSRDFDWKYIDRWKIRRKDSTDASTIEGVLDTTTTKRLYHLINRGYIERIIGTISAGKEAHIYLADPGEKMITSYENHPGIEKIAIKIYRTKTLDFKKIRIYLLGDPRFRRIRKKSYRIMEQWAEKEYKNLSKMAAVGINVPKPIKVLKNILLMDFLGDRNLPAPQIRLVRLEDYHYYYKKVIDQLKLCIQEANLVHSDLSEYNMLLHKSKVYFIDVGQAVLTSHPYAGNFLLRDLINVNGFFGKKGAKVQPIKALFDEIALEKVQFPKNELSFDI